jgi:hypothetical protein
MVTNVVLLTVNIHEILLTTNGADVVLMVNENYVLLMVNGDDLSFDQPSTIYQVSLAFNKCLNNDQPSTIHQVSLAVNNASIMMNRQLESEVTLNIFGN